MRNMYKSNGEVVILETTEFLNVIESVMVMYNINSLEEMIERSSFVINNKFYDFRYDKDPRLDLYDLYSCYIDEDGHQKYSIENPDNYNITKFEVRSDSTFRFDLSFKY